jgi:hypothetical protein
LHGAAAVLRREGVLAAFLLLVIVSIGGAGLLRALGVL